MWEQRLWFERLLGDLLQLEREGARERHLNKSDCDEREPSSEEGGGRAAFPPRAMAATAQAPAQLFTN